MNVKYMLDEGAVAPTKAHDTDAGFDLYAMEDGTIFPSDGKAFRTGVHVILDKGWCGLLVSKSGLMTKRGITTTGLIDAGYTGEIMVKMFNHTHGYYEVKKGDKISQLIILPVPDVQLTVTESAPVTERGENGFGSSGR